MSFQDAYERILQSTGLRTQTDVAAMLGVKQSSISDAKRRNHIPDSWILTLFNKKSLNPSWIRTGEGPQYDRGSDRFCRGRGFYIGREKPCVTHGCAENFTGIFSARFCIV